MADKRNYSIAVVESALKILQIFLEDGRGEQGAKEIGDRLAMNRGRAFRILSTLETEGFVRQDPQTKKYRLGLKLFELGQAVSRQFNLPGVARPVLAELTDLTGETSYVYALSGLEAVTVAKQECRQSMRITAELGRRDTLEVGAACNLLLAYRTPEEIEQVLGAGSLPQYTAHTVTDRTEMLCKLAEIRRLGYHISLEEEQEGVAAIAAPIRDARGQVTAAVAIAIPSVRFLPEKLQQLLDLVCRAGERISAEIGFGLGASPRGPLDGLPA